MEELCQPSLNGRGGPIAPIAIQATNFGLNIKVNGVIDDAFCMYLFPHSLTHHATAWFDHLPRNSINTFEQMAKMFLGKYLPPSMVTKLRNEITNFRQHPDESLFEAWEGYKLSIDRCLNHNMLPVTQIDTFYNRLTLRHRDTINAAAATVGQTHNVYDAEAYNQGGNSYQPQGASHGPNPPPAYQAPGYQALVHQPLIPQPQVMPTTEFTNYMEVKDAFLKNMQTNMTSLTNSNLELKNIFGKFMKINIASSSGLGTLPSNTVTNPKEDLKGITTRSGTAYQGPTIPNTSSSLPQVVELKTEIFLPKLSPTCMTLELADRSISRPVGVAEDVFVKVGTFYFSADFVVVDFDADPRVPLILRRSFLKTRKDLINVYEGELTLRVGKEAITFNLDQTSRYSANYNDMTANRIDVIDMACEEYSQEVLGFSDVIMSGNPTPYYDPIISSRNRVAVGCMMAIFHDMIEKTMKVFMDDFSVFRNSFRTCLSHLEMMLKWCEDTNLCLNYEKSHFMVKEGIVLGHKISKNEIEVDKAKVDVIVKLPHPTTIKVCEIFDVWGIDFMGPFSSSRGNKYIPVAVDYLSKWVEAKALPTNDARVVCKFLKYLFARFDLLVPSLVIMTSGQVEVSNRGFKRILERTVGENHASWSDKLDDALWDFRTAFKIPIGCTPYKLVYGKACHLPIELEHKAYWALKHANFNL
nr:reverse transcriptase domain-containing protein [Tanacetum cinerariifolium]